MAFPAELDQWLNSRPVRKTMPIASESESLSGISTIELQSMLSRAENLLEKLESLLSRSKEMHQRLSLGMNAVANDQIHTDLHSDEILKSMRAEAA
jgi:CII-binding regulator of phage lambda lysogenization HflD